MMSDVLASSKQDMAPGPSGGVSHGRNSSAERLNRRMNAYRNLHEKQLPTYDRAMNSSNSQHYNETLMLRQRFIEANKTKKGTKKSASEKAQSKMAGAMNKDNSNNSPATGTGASVNKMNR